MEMLRSLFECSTHVGPWGQLVGGITMVAHRLVAHLGRRTMLAQNPLASTVGLITMAPKYTGPKDVAPHWVAPPLVVQTTDVVVSHAPLLVKATGLTQLPQAQGSGTPFLLLASPHLYNLALSLFGARPEGPATPRMAN